MGPNTYKNLFEPGRILQNGCDKVWSPSFEDKGQKKQTFLTWKGKYVEFRIGMQVIHK